MRGAHEEQPIHQLAARAFHETAVGALRERGEATTQTAVAAIVAESPQKYSDCLKGREGSLDRIYRWLARWAESGRPELELVVRAGSVEVRRADD
jgi:hypothetical protein